MNVHHAMFFIQSLSHDDVNVAATGIINIVSFARNEYDMFCHLQWNKKLIRQWNKKLIRQWNKKHIRQ